VSETLADPELVARLSHDIKGPGTIGDSCGFETVVVPAAGGSTRHVVPCLHTSRGPHDA
jgi:hypothetical protein